MSGRMPLFRSVSLVIAAVLVLGLLPASPSHPDRAAAQGVSDLVSRARAAQENPVQPDVTDTTYRSPLGFEIEWDEDEWTLENGFATYGLEVALFEPDADALVQVWGFMDFGGDASECLEEMEGFYPVFFEVEELEAVDAGVDDPVGPGEDVEFATFDYLESSRDDEGQRLYIGCQTLVEGESVNVIVVSATADDFEVQVAAADEFLDDGLTIDPVEVDVEAFAERVDTLSADIDRFYNRSLRLEDDAEAPYEGPLYLTFSEPTETECLSTNIDGTVDRTNPERDPGAGPAYCGTDQVVLVDAPWMVIYVIPQGGDVLLAAILAHESGHHLQDYTGWEERNNYDYSDPKDTFIAEQQADCLAGAYMRSTVLRGIYTQRDVEAALALFFDIGGFEEGVDHGTGEEREDAFQLGYDDGFDSCGLYDRPD